MNVKSVEKENGKAKIVVEIDKAEFEAGAEQGVRQVQKRHHAARLPQGQGSAENG